MISRLISAAVLAVVLAGTGVERAAAETPKALVQALYTEPDLGFGRLDSRRYFAVDLESALRGGARPQAVGPVDFDYRYGAQDLQITGLQLLEEIDNDQARVVAVFKNYGAPESVDWILCRRADGDWRIMDASSNTYRDKDPWDLRQMLGLPADRAEVLNMIGKLNHVGVATPSIAEAIKPYRDLFGATSITETRALPDQGVSVCFVNLPNAQIELLEPYGEDSPIAGFLARNPKGGQHHVCFEVDDIYAARDDLRAKGATVLGTGEPRIGAHGVPVIFVHPKDAGGVLVELMQTPAEAHA